MKYLQIYDKNHFFQKYQSYFFNSLQTTFVMGTKKTIKKIIALYNLNQ